MFNFGFIVEQALGHITHYQNLKYWVSKDASIQPNWMPVGASTNDIWGKLPLIRNNWSLQVSLRTREVIKAAMKLHPDALFLHTQTLALFAIPYMRRIPTIISTDATPLNLDSIATGYNHKLDGNCLIHRSKFQWNKSTYNAAAAIVTFSEWTKQSLIYDYGIAAEKIMVIPPGLDLRKWNVKPDKTVEDNSALSLRLLFVGGDFVRKGGNILLEAFRNISNSSNQDYTLDIVTKDTSLKQKLAGVENIQVYNDLTPNSQPLKQLYQKADIFVFPTEADCLPNAISEAMAAGLPIVTTNTGALCEQVEHGVNGIIVPPFDADSLAIALRLLKENPEKITAMAAASRCIAEKRFDAKSNYGAILSLMKTISQKSAFQGNKSRILSPSSVKTCIY